MKLFLSLNMCVCFAVSHCNLCEWNNVINLCSKFKYIVSTIECCLYGYNKKEKEIVTK